MKRTRRLTCGDKTPHTSRGKAEDAMHGFYRRQFNGFKPNNVSVYKCNDHWHWGHFRRRKA